MRLLRMPGNSFSMPWTIAACVRAMPSSSSASCWAEICMGAPPFLRYAAMVASPAMFNWRRPSNLGVKDGRLAPCKRTPNCVSSHAAPEDREHYISPLAFRGTMRELRAVLESMPRSTVITADAQYLYAEFRTPLMRYVDDLELYYDGRAGLVQVRSASRLGRRDFGVNRKRVEALRSRVRTITRAAP